MTNKHVVGDPNASYTVITNDGNQYEAKVVALDPLTDIAIIKIENPENKTFQTLDVIENEESIKIGQFAIAI
jgi:serine protease Do